MRVYLTVSGGKPEVALSNMMSLPSAIYRPTASAVNLSQKLNSGGPLNSTPLSSSSSASSNMLIGAQQQSQIAAANLGYSLTPAAAVSFMRSMTGTPGTVGLSVVRSGVTAIGVSTSDASGITRMVC